MSKLYEYALTIKKTRGKPTPNDYAQYLQWLEEKGFLIGNVNFELTKGLHCHCVIRSKNQITAKDTSLYRDRYGWNLLAKKCYSLSGWVRYSEKDMKTPGVEQLMESIAEEKAIAEAWDLAPEYWGKENPYDPPEWLPEEEMVNCYRLSDPPSEPSEEIIEIPQYPYFDIRSVSS